MEKRNLFVRKHGIKLMLLISVVFLLVFMILPIIDMFSRSVIENGSFTWKYFIEYFSKSLYSKILFNTIKLSFLIGIITI